MMSEIKPCPFCGGQPERNDSKIWTGTKFHIFRVFFQHLCEDVSGSQRRYMEVSGTLEQEAIDCWNTRTNEATYIKKDEGGQD